MLICLLTIGSFAASAQDKVERPEDVKGNSINKFVKESFDIYDSTFTIAAKVDSLNKDLDIYEASVAAIKSDAAMATEGVKAGTGNAKESAASELKKRKILRAKIMASNTIILATLKELNTQTVKLSKESPKTLQK